MSLSLSIGILGQVWCLIVSIPYFCPVSHLIAVGTISRMLDTTGVFA